MKSLYFLLLVSIISVIQCQIPTTLYIVMNSFGSENNQLQVIDLGSGNMILNNHWNGTVLEESVYSVFDFTNNSLKVVCATEETNGTIIDLYSYTISTNEAVLLSSITTTADFEFLYEAPGYNAQLNTVYLPGVGSNTTNLTLIAFDFQNNEINFIEIDIAYPSLPVGSYNQTSNNYYLGFYEDDGSTPTMIQYDVGTKQIVNVCSDLNFQDASVFVFLSNGNPFIVMYGSHATYILLYTINLESCQSKLVYKIETFYQGEYVYYVNNNDYIVFFTIPNGSPTSIQYTMVDLTTFAEVYQSKPMDSSATLSFLMTIL